MLTPYAAQLVAAERYSGIEHVPGVDLQSHKGCSVSFQQSLFTTWVGLEGNRTSCAIIATAPIYQPSHWQGKLLAILRAGHTHGGVLVL